MYQSLPQFAAYVKEQSQAILGGKYRGVHITTHGPSIDVSDETKPSGTVAILFRDLIGQPVWSDPNTVMIKTVMRSDIHAFDWVTLPEGLMTVTESSGVTWGAEGTPAGPLAFQGEFQVQDVRHYGDFRHPDGNAWCTVLQAMTKQAGGGGGDEAGAAAPISGEVQNLLGAAGISPTMMKRKTRRYV